MLKNRLIACLIINNGIVVQSVGFKKYLPVGSPAIAVEFLNSWGVDEIVILDIDKSRLEERPDFELIKTVSGKCFVPLTVGGGIKSCDDIRKLLHSGADKVSLNTTAIQNPDLIKEASDIFGDQCIVISIDVKKNSDGTYHIFNRNITDTESLSLVEFVQTAEKLGAGEILLTSVDQDGKGDGYDTDLIQKVSGQVNLPVIACGGVGSPEHFFQGISQGHASAVAAGNYFHFTEHSVIKAKAYLKQKEAEIRLDTYASYLNASIDKQGRLLKKPDHELETLRFIHHPEEII